MLSPELPAGKRKVRQADFSASVEMTIPLGSKKTSNGKGNRRSFDCVAHEVL
jgi:hypothetical protein